jgi:tetratricopeptide (TPR) repeat protein
MASVGDWDELINEAEAERFVGRERELETFRQQISLTKPRYLIFYITGQGGAGKTILLNRYREIAKELEFLLADCDEPQRDVPAVLGRFAHQLAEQGFPAKHFDERYKTYRQRMHEIETDPEAPQGLAAILGRTVVRSAFIVGDLVPGLRKGLDILPQESLETQASEWASYLSKKLTNKDEVPLVREPVPILTPLFFEDLNKVALAQKVLLCFDNFEAARSELREWLIRLREYKPSQNIRIAIAGRDQPGAKWDPLRSVTKTIRVDVFTEQEAESFLDAYTIIDPKSRKEILELSGRLPVLMSWLAAVEGSEVEPSIPTHDIVERFLRWVTDPALKQVALVTAIPHNFNTDILKLLLEQEGQIVDEHAAFDWLQTMPFVKQGSDGWEYHDVLRRLMLTYQRQKSPQMYRQMHTVLANFYNTFRDELRLTEEEHWRNEEWRKYSLAYAYHFLVADPNRHWGKVMSLFAVAIRKRRSFAVEMIEMLNADDIHDELSFEQNSMVQLFRQQLQAIKEDSPKDGFEMFNKLCGIKDLSSQAKGYALAYRGECHQTAGKWEKALSDFEDALRYIPTDAWTVAGKGVSYVFLGQYQEALNNFDRAIALDKKYTWAITSRGETYRLMGHYQEALANFDRAIVLDEKYTWAIASRGETYRLMGHYQEALANFDRAIVLDEKYTWAIASRGETYRLMGHYQEALANLDRAIELDQESDWMISERGDIYFLMGCYQEALADFARAIALDEKEDWYPYRRALIYSLSDQRSAFEKDIQTAIELAEATLHNTPDNWRVGFNLALYNLVDGNLTEAESQYAQLTSACSSLSDLQGAVEDLTDFLTIQPSNELAQHIRTQLQTRRAELKQSPTA